MVVHGYPHLSRILRQIGGPLAGLVAVSVAVVLLDRGHGFRHVAVPDMTVTMLGVAVSILLGFRTNAAYARWWEARTLWGGMVNGSRSLARQATSLVADPEAGRRLVRTQVAFVHATRCTLRRQDPWPDVDRFVDGPTAAALRAARNVPVALLQQMGSDVAEVAAAGHLTERRLERIDATLTDLTNVLGGLERIKNTPLPRQYDVYPELLIFVYCLVLPVVLVEEVGLLTPLVTAVVAAAFLVLNRVGKNLEDPFEDRPYDVPMSALSRTIEIDLRQAIGDADLPEPARPVDGVLW